MATDRAAARAFASRLLPDRSRPPCALDAMSRETTPPSRFVTYYVTNRLGPVVRCAFGENAKKHIYRLGGRAGVWHSDGVMKITPKKILLFFSLFAFGFPLVVPAARADEKADKKAERAAAREQRQLKKYDKNHDGQLDETEKAAIAADRAAARQKRLLKKYDANADGQLDESEKAAIAADRAAAREKRKLKKYDTNHDGQLDEAETAAMKAGTHKKKAADQAEADEDNDNGDEES
jgi:hypothetical protein